MRGFAAGWVFLVHIHSYWLSNVRPPTFTADGLAVRFMGFGGAGVDIFIVLSGVCLTLPLLTAEGEVRLMDNHKFFVRRAYRLLPAYFAALVLVMAIELVPSLRPSLVARDLTGWDLLSHATLTFPLFGQSLGSVNGSMWSIALEATLYLAFPLLLLVFRWRGLPAVLSVSVALGVAWSFFTAWWAGTSWFPTLLPEPELLFPARWLQFAFGMATAVLITRAPRCLRLGAWGTLLVGLPLGIYGYAKGVGVVSHVGWALVGGALLVLLSRVGTRWFTAGPLHWLTRLGVISFSFYLLHQPVLLLTAGLGRAAGWPPLTTTALALFTAGSLTVALAAVFYRFVERPFLVRGSMRDVVLKPAEVAGKGVQPGAPTGQTAPRPGR
jgi:peptidoglycan/LPS O-acetylase OafA/YrhL